MGNNAGWGPTNQVNTGGGNTFGTITAMPQVGTGITAQPGQYTPFQTPEWLSSGLWASSQPLQNNPTTAYGRWGWGNGSTNGYGMTVPGPWPGSLQPPGGVPSAPGGAMGAPPGQPVADQFQPQGGGSFGPPTPSGGGNPGGGWTPPNPAATGWAVKGPNAVHAGVGQVYPWSGAMGNPQALLNYFQQNPSQQNAMLTTAGPWSSPLTQALQRGGVDPSAIRGYVNSYGAGGTQMGSPAPTPGFGNVPWTPNVPRAHQGLHSGQLLR